MFDYVPKKDLDTERERRIAAEAAAEQARQSESRAMSMLESEQVAHREEMADLLDRFMPKLKDPVPGFGVPTELGGLSFEQIMRTPAVGKRGMRERNAAAQVAKAHEEAASNGNTVDGQRASLLPDEAAILDRQLEATKQ